MGRTRVSVLIVALVALVAAGCASGSSSDDASPTTTSPAAGVELAGVWSTDDGAVTFEFLDDGETALFTTEHFEECTATYEGDGDQVVVDIECGSPDNAEMSSLGSGATGVLTVGLLEEDTYFYVAEWTLGFDGDFLEEGMSGGPAEGESAAAVTGVIFAENLLITGVDEDASVSTVSYLHFAGMTLTLMVE